MDKIFRFKKNCQIEHYRMLIWKGTLKSCLVKLVNCLITLKKAECIIVWSKMVCVHLDLSWLVNGLAVIECTTWISQDLHVAGLNFHCEEFWSFFHNLVPSSLPVCMTKGNHFEHLVQFILWVKQWVLSTPYTECVNCNTCLNYSIINWH